MTLDTYLEARNEPFTFKTTMQVGLALLEQLRIIHQSGYCHNDLKLENILIGNAPSLPVSLQQLDILTLIDYGLVGKFIDEYGMHKPRVQTKEFKGNLVFASKNAFKGQSLSRRDDLISLGYLLLYLLDGDLNFMMSVNSNDSEPDQQAEFQAIGQMKV